MRVILASSSPNRQELLRRLGLSFEVLAPNIEEDFHMESDPYLLAQKLSAQKAEASRAQLTPQDLQEDFLLMAFDSLAVFEGKPFGKARSREEAREFLRLFRGKSQQIVTGYTLYLQKSGAFKEVSAYEITNLLFRKDYTEKDIDSYLALNDWQGKCGAYSILGPGIFFVDRIEGDFQNIVGVPVLKIFHHLSDWLGESFWKDLNFL